MSADAGPRPARIGARRRRDAAEDFRLMADSAPVMIWVADPDGRAVYFNRPWLAFTGRTLESEAGLGWADGIHPDDRAATLDAWLDAIRRAQPVELEYRLRRHDGELRWVLARGTPLGRDGRLQGFVGSCVDITDRRIVEEERARMLERERSARADAESATLARDHFLSIVSHDLRTPLNGIKTWAHFLDQQLRDADPAIRRAIAGVMIGVDQQAALIDDLLDLTRALGGTLGLIKHPVALLPVLADAVEAYRPAAREREITLVTRYEVGEAEVHGDAARLRQVFCNLVANAVKFTPRGGTVWVEAGLDESMARVEVRDNGAGIPPDLVARVFDPFNQADQRASRAVQQGVGLGLALAQRLAELHGGHVTCESAGANRGSTFRVHLPLRRESIVHPALTPSHAGATRLPSLEGISVLLIDDQREARESLAAVLGQAGASVRPAASAREALALLASSPADSPEVVVCDIAMPEEDGFATLRRIRAWEAGQPQPAMRRPAVAISAYSEREDRLRALSEGFQMHLSKPISPAELMLVISNAARAARP
jgi:PAS domain S-box-containing protein